MKKITTFLIAIAFSVMLFGGVAAEASWSLQGTDWYYYDTSGQLVKSKWIGQYYVDSTGRMVTNQFVGVYFVGEDGKYIPNFHGGWYLIGGKWYYYTAAGVKTIGWVRVGSNWYYTNSSGVMQTGWLQISGSYYYFNSGGRMIANGWVTQNNSSYYLNSYGRIARNTWVKYNNHWYWMDENGAMIHDRWLQVNNFWYYFQANGVMLSNSWIMLDNHYYYLGANGSMQLLKWIRYGGNYYFVAGNGMRVESQWLSWNGNWFYLRENGVMATGWLMLYDNTGKPIWYYLNSSGIMYKGWIGVNGRYYYMGTNGIMTIGWKKVDGYWYYFNSGGVLQTNTWLKNSNGIYFYVDGAGKMLTGLYTLNGKKYYFNSSGAMQVNTTVTVAGVTYTIDASGVCTPRTNITKPTSVKMISDFLFFTWWESGCDYSQTGGDGGKACGYYQFDYRYALQPFIDYCYNSNSTKFAEFANFRSSVTSNLNLLGNTALYSAWATVFARDPYTFAGYQDTYAKNVYYTPAANSLLSKGINISTRPDVVKGVLYSCAIQHGPESGALVFTKAGVTNGDTNAQLIQKVYTYRIAKYGYSSRYQAEMAEALSRL